MSSGILPVLIREIFMKWIVKAISAISLAFCFTVATAAVVGDSYTIGFYDTEDNYLYGGSFTLGATTGSGQFNVSVIDINGASSADSPIRWALPTFMDETAPQFMNTLLGLAGTFSEQYLFTYNMKQGYNGGWDHWIYSPLSFNTGFYKLSPVVATVSEPSAALVMGMGGLLVMGCRIRSRKKVVS